jgi:carbon-monoxide dehydrogenase medium subunit
MIPAAFDYVRPATLDEAFAALADPEARPLAGGHSLLPMMKLRLAHPTTLVDLAGLQLRGVRGNGALRIGALTTYDELLEAELPNALRDAVEAVGDVQVRNAGTLGGAVAHADPASDVAAALLALDARVVLQSPSGIRELALEDFYLGPYYTAIEEQELVTEIVVPEPDGASAYVAFENRASGYPLAGAAVCGDAIGLTGYPTHPVRLRGALADVDSHAGEYCRHLAEVAIRRAQERAR